MGDLVLTCTGELSRNRTVGYELGKGRKLGGRARQLGPRRRGREDRQERATICAKKLGRGHAHHRARSTPCSTSAKPVDRALTDLMSRELGHEFDPRAVARATLR